MKMKRWLVALLKSKAKGFVLLSTIVVIMVVFSMLGSILQMKTYQRLQKIQLQNAREISDIEIYAINCILNQDCPKGYTYHEYDSLIKISVNDNHAEIVVTGKHSLISNCSIDIEKSRLITYTYTAND